MKKLRVYRDTSVVGGCFDPEFAAWSNALMADTSSPALTLARYSERWALRSATCLDQTSYPSEYRPGAPASVRNGLGNSSARAVSSASPASL